MADGGEILYGWVLCEVAKVPGEDDAPETFTLVVLGFTMDEADFTQASYHWPICAIQDAAVILAVANGTVIGWSDDSSLVVRSCRTRSRTARPSRSSGWRSPLAR